MNAISVSKFKSSPMSVPFIAAKYNDQVLFAHMLVKDREAYNYLFDHYSPALYGSIMNSVKDEKASEEILGEVLVKIWDNIQHFNPSQSRLFVWMLNITRNHCVSKNKGYFNQADAIPHFHGLK